jgi:hypothetical protein
MARFTIIENNEDAILGRSGKGRGGVFHSDSVEGVLATSASTGTAAVAGIQSNGTGAGVYGEHTGAGPAIVGVNKATGVGALFHSEALEAVVADSNAPDSSALAVFQKNPACNKAALYVEHAVGQTAGFFRGNVIVTGDVSFPGEDCAEEFTIQPDVMAEPGTVMAIGDDGKLAPCEAEYEKRVAGVVAGAGTLRPGIVLGRQHDGDPRRREPIALLGKVFCKVDAGHGPIAIGDLLTTSATVGHAMKAGDAVRAFGAVIGKAMAPLREGRGLIPILIALQ